MNKKPWSSRSIIETKTANGALYRVECASGKGDEIKQFLTDNVYQIDVLVTHTTNVGHGGLGRYSRYDIQQHKYAGGEGGYIEVLEVKNPPDGYHPVILHSYDMYGHTFCEFDTVTQAKSSFEKVWGCYSEVARKRIAKSAGYRRLVECGRCTPWFYAIGDEELHGDYAIANGLEDDPVFRLGRRFVVLGDNDIPVVKTCMGCRFVAQDSDGSYPDLRSERRLNRLVYFDNGSTYIIPTPVTEAQLLEGSLHGSYPRPLQEGEEWIVEAMKKFARLLAGGSMGFQIPFDDGSIFKGSLSPKSKGPPTAAGQYLVEITIAETKEVKKGTVDFEPTREMPDIVTYTKNTYELKNPGQKLSKVAIIKHRSNKSIGFERKWAGVFFSRGQLKASVAASNITATPVTGVPTP